MKGLFASPPKSAEDLFAAEVAAALTEQMGVTSIGRGDDFSLRFERDGKQNTAYLGPTFTETRDMTPTERAARIRRYILSFTEGADGISWKEVEERLVPVLRPATFFHTDVPGSDGNAIRRPFAPFLISAVGIDSDNSFRYVSRSQVADWGVDLAAVFDLAGENAKRYFDGSDVRPYSSGGPFRLWHVARDDSYEVSRLLVPGWLASFAGKVNGRPVAIIPSRSRLIVGGDGDEPCIAHLVEAARREFDASPRSISPALYTVDAAGGVVPLVLPAGHPQAIEVAVGHVLLALNEYRIQAERLQPQVGDDTLVAKLLAFTRDDYGIMTIATWTREGRPALLPRANQLLLVTLGDGEAEKDQVAVPWQTALDLMGDCLHLEPDCDPPRWRTERWPDPVLFEKLRAAQELLPSTP